MKTLDEAMVILQCHVPGGPEAVKLKMEEMASGMEKRASVVREIAQNATVIDYLDHYIDKAGPQVDFSVHMLALNVFIEGVLIGMEMKRQEL